MVSCQAVRERRNGMWAMSSVAAAIAPPPRANFVAVLKPRPGVARAGAGGGVFGFTGAGRGRGETPDGGFGTALLGGGVSGCGVSAGAARTQTRTNEMA